MRAVDFIPAKGIDIHAQRLDIDLPMRCVRHAIDTQQCVGVRSVDGVRDGADVVDRAEDVAGVGAGYENRFGGE